MKANMHDAVSEFNREKVKVSRIPVNIIVNPARIEQKLDIDKKPSSGRGDIFSFFHFWIFIWMTYIKTKEKKTITEPPSQAIVWESITIIFLS